MSKILKNTTGSNIELIELGVTIPASDQITVNVSDYDILASTDSILELVPYLNSGDIVVNDGITDLGNADGLSVLEGELSRLSPELINNDRIKVEVTGTLSDAKVQVSSDDGTSGYLEEKISAASSKIAVTVSNPGADEDLQIDLNPGNVDTSTLNNDAGFLTETTHDSLPADNPHNVTKTQVGLGNVDNTSDADKPVSTATQTALDLKYDATNPNGYETPAQLNARDTANRDRTNHTGTQLASTISDFTSAVQTAETTTSIALASNILTYTDEDGNDTDIDLSLYLDDTNLARITSGVLDSNTGIVTFTRDDLTTFTVDFSNIIPTIEIDNIINVAKNGNDTTGDGTLGRPYLTIGKAVTVVNGLTPSSTNHFTIQVGPGIFVEAPITMDSYTTIRGEGGRTTVVASNNSANLITMSDNMTLDNIQLTGVTNSSNYLVSVEAVTSGLVGISSVILVNSSNGIKTTSSSGKIIVVVNEVASSQLTGDVLLSESGSELVLDSGLFLGNGTSTVAISQDGGDISIYNAKVETCLSALDIRSNSGNVKSYSLDIDESTIPLRQTGTANLFINGARVDATKAQISDTGSLEGFFYGEVEGENTITILSELSVGVHGRGKESAFGEGDSYVNGMLVYSYNGSSYTSRTDLAKSVESSTFTFDGTAVNNALYVSTAFPEATTLNYLKWHGIKANIGTAAVGGEIVSEYWNGSSWVEFNTMSAQSSGQYLPLGNELFARTGNEQIRFNYEIQNDWNTNDPMSLGIDLYWVRFRIASALTTAPIFEQFKIHTSRTELNSDGFVEYFGSARPINILPFDSGSFQAANNSPTNQDLWLGDNLGVGRIENQFVAGTTDRVGLVRPLPLDLDTSCPVRLILHLHSEFLDSSPDLDFTIRYSNSKVGESVYDSTSLSPTTALRQKTLTGSVTNPGTDVQFKLEFDLDVSDFVTRDTNNIGDLFWITIQRDNDGNNSDISLIQLELQYVKWNNGGHL